jgi:hypothetical protein
LLYYDPIIIIQLWKNPDTGELHYQVHPSAVYELYITPIPDGKREDAGNGALYPDGAHITDLKKVRDLVYELQRPSISPEVRLPPLYSIVASNLSIALSIPKFVYPHDWSAAVCTRLGPHDSRIFVALGLRMI